ncbi:uncharacterized protein TNCV_1181391 [Trichonephila clavipes]|nr:uncharacterized protein TNCV_1181391 [Trichonephila clavipes]
MKRKENFQWLPKELHQLKYEAISVPEGSVRLAKKTQERKSSTCYLFITKGVTSSSPVPLKTRRERERGRDKNCDRKGGASIESLRSTAIHNILAPVRVSELRFEPTVPLVEIHPVI